MPFARIRPGIDQLLRIDACGRRTRDIADVVGARAARAKAEILNALDQGHAVLGQNFPDLDVRAGGDVAVAPAVTLGEVGKPRQLPMPENAVGHAQPAHVGILRGRDIE